MSERRRPEQRRDPGAYIGRKPERDAAPRRPAASLRGAPPGAHGQGRPTIDDPVGEVRQNR
jgi:hypothetical protein